VGGLVAARHINNWGASIIVLLAEAANGSEPARRLSILEKMQVRVEQKLDDISSDKFDLIIDSLLGYNQRGDPHPTVASLVRFANDSDLSLIALDIPTGLDPNSGVAHSPCIKGNTDSHSCTAEDMCFTSEEGMKFADDLYLVPLLARLYCFSPCRMLNNLTGHGASRYLRPQTTVCQIRNTWREAFR
jgi:YjeF-related protein N-terminus